MSHFLAINATLDNLVTDYVVSKKKTVFLKFIHWNDCTQD